MTVRLHGYACLSSGVGRARKLHHDPVPVEILHDHAVRLLASWFTSVSRPRTRGSRSHRTPPARRAGVCPKPNRAHPWPSDRRRRRCGTSGSPVFRDQLRGLVGKHADQHLRIVQSSVRRVVPPRVSRRPHVHRPHRRCPGPSLHHALERVAQIDRGTELLHLRPLRQDRPRSASPYPDLDDVAVEMSDLSNQVPELVTTLDPDQSMFAHHRVDLLERLIEEPWAVRGLRKDDRVSGPHHENGASSPMPAAPLRTAPFASRQTARDTVISSDRPSTAYASHRPTEDRGFSPSRMVR